VTGTLYDFLGVSRDADATEIRSEWRTLIADLDPSDPRFRAYNEAAETLLDPARRAAYDETLEPVEPEPVEPEPAPVAPEETSSPSAAPTSATASSRRLPTIPAWVLGVVGLVTALAVVAVVLLWSQPSEGSVESASTDAVVAAQTAIEPILSYDYRTLDQDQDDAHRYLTSDYQADYDKFFNGVVRPNAAETKTVVTVKVIDAAVVREGDDRVQVLLFINRPTTNKARTVVFKDQVTVTMAKEDGRWLVDRLSTTPPTA
jgi:Mce-associated membrane protein